MMTTLQAARIARREGIATAQIQWLMGRVHVGTPDDEVRADIDNRTASWSSVDAREAARVLAIAYHRRNQSDYVFVMRGCR